MKGMQVLYGQLDGLETVLELAEIGRLAIEFGPAMRNAAHDPVKYAKVHVDFWAAADAFLAGRGGEHGTV